MPEYHPIHSDFIIHWTGKDIDKAHRVKPNDFSKPNKVVDDLYLERLKLTLEHGLWMIKDHSEATFTLSRKTLKRPVPYRTCFTELRLSQVRHHASKFGRLGIGFKRFFLFDRMGAPIIYHMESRHNWYVPASMTPADYSLTFLKQMSEPHAGLIRYGYFDESEWRIIYDEPIDAHLRATGKEDIANRFRKVTPSHPPAISNSPAKPGYLIPIEGKWFAVIIYPSISAKVRAQSDPVIQELIGKLKPTYTGSGNNKASAPYEDYNRPIEMDIDACSNM